MRNKQTRDSLQNFHGNFSSDMIKGYQDMAKINVQLSEEATYVCNEAFEVSEVFLSERDADADKAGGYLLR